MKSFTWVLVATVFAMAMGATSTLAADKTAKKPGSSVVTGTLALVKEADGKVSATTITTKSGTVYKLSGLTQNVTSFDGKEVSVKGEVKEEAGTMTLIVKGHITIAGEAKEKPEKKAKKGKK